MKFILSENEISHLSLILPRGDGYHPLENFSLSPQNQKESDLSHLGNLKYILCGQFDEGKSGVGEVSRQRWRVRGWLPPKKIKSRHFAKSINCMVLKLTVYITNVISFSYKPKKTKTKTKQRNKNKKKNKNKTKTKQNQKTNKKKMKFRHIEFFF